MNDKMSLIGEGKMYTTYESTLLDTAQSFSSGPMGSKSRTQ